MQIPKVVHQIWFQGEPNIPPDLLEYHNSWIKHNSDYTVIVWDQVKIESLINTCEPWIKETYYSYDKMIQKIDFAKYAILYHHGGIYMDMDIKCLQSLNKTPHLYDADVVLSEMYSHKVQKIVGYMYGLSYETPLINNGTIFCVKHHQIMLDTLKEAHSRKHVYNINNGIHVFITTGPFCLSSAYHSCIKTDKIKIINNTYFEACDVDEHHNNKCDIPKHAIGIHIFKNLWVTDTEKMLLKIYFIVLSNLLYICLFLVVIFIIAFYPKFRKSLPYFGKL